MQKDKLDSSAVFSHPSAQYNLIGIYSVMNLICATYI